MFMMLLNNIYIYKYCRFPRNIVFVTQNTGHIVQKVVYLMLSTVLPNKKISAVDNSPWLSRPLQGAFAFINANDFFVNVSVSDLVGKARINPTILAVCYTTKKFHIGGIRYER